MEERDLVYKFKSRIHYIATLFNKRIAKAIAQFYFYKEMDHSIHLFEENPKMDSSKNVQMSQRYAWYHSMRLMVK